MPTSNDASTPSILIVAAEASSSLYAQRLLEHWQSAGRRVRAFGIGSQEMEKLGFEIVGRSENLAVVGIQEVLAHWDDIKAAFHGLLDLARERKPKAALLLDYPDFNLRLAKKLKAMGIPVIYYVSPQVWAWRQSRVKLIKKVVDKILVLFPFEKDFYERHGVDCEFVGHPLLDELGDELFSESQRRLQRSRYGLSDGDVVLGLMPGSRRSELKHHLQTQLETARALYKENPRLKTALFVAPTFEKEEIQARLPSLDFPLMLIKDEPFKMIGLADVILCASGTATLMVGLMEKPLVIMYRMNALTAFLAKTFVKSTRYFGMINLILEDEVGPEFFQERADVAHLGGALKPLLENSQKRAEIALRLRGAKTRLGEKGATRRVARALDPFLEG